MTAFEEARRAERRAAADAAWERSGKWVRDLSGYGYDLPVFTKLRDVLRDVRMHRQTYNLSGGDYETETVAVNVVTTVMADEVLAAHAGQDGIDPHTLNVIVAGLRCRARPYCTGCIACQTITAPTRPAAPLKTSRW